MRTKALLALVVFGCAPADTIPSAPNHPANPQAPIAAEPSPAEIPEPAPPKQQGGMDHSGMDHSGSPAPAGDKAAIAAAEQAAFEKARPVFEKHCAKCHSSAGAKATKKTLGHFTIDKYPFEGHHATEMADTIRKVLGVSGKKPTMPKDNPGAVHGEELDAVVAWTKAWEASHAAGIHKHEGGGANDSHGGH